MATGYTKEWIGFFTGCGIPDDVATMYALIFYENRIHKNMLLDLNKEYLRDMGITVMGDVIAILRHAKIVHEKYMREQILSVEDDLCIDQNTYSSDSSPVSKKITPMKRMLEHYTRKYNSEIEPGTEVQVILPNKKPITQVLSKMAQRVGLKNNVPLKKKVEISIAKEEVKEKELGISVPKVRRVLPENEGGYKIKMPSGITERSKKLLEQAKKRKIKTVFERLGESSVSSTTSDVSSGISITSSNSSSIASKEKNSSVFARLGEKTGIVSSTSAEDMDYVSPDQLPYAGILKSSGISKKNLPNTTMRADDEQQKSEAGKSIRKKSVSVKRRLGLKNQESLEAIVPDKSVLKTKLSSIQEEAKQTKGKTILKLKNNDVAKNEDSIDLDVKKVTKIKNSALLQNRFTKLDSDQGKVTISTTLIESVEKRSLKRKLDSNSSSDTNPSKKVRFGKTTHRLIPSTSAPEPMNNLKNYPKLTMIINNNRMQPSENVTLSSGIRIGSLNSDKIKEKITMKDRIGKKPVLQGRLGKPIGGPAKLLGARKPISVHDRLG